MNDISFEEMAKLDCESRYEIFLSMVAEQREIWILVNDEGQFLKIDADDNSDGFLPVWPHSDFTHSYCKSSSDKLSPKSIAVPEFFAKWISGLEGDGLQVGVFPGAGADVWVMEPAEVKSDLQDEFSNFAM